MKTKTAGEDLVRSGLFRAQEFSRKKSNHEHILRHANVTTRDGLLVLTAKGLSTPIIDSRNVPVYFTSARVTTKGIKRFGQGIYTFKTKCRLVKGAGPADWSDPHEFSPNHPDLPNHNLVWPEGGEIDFVEYNYQGNKERTNSGVIGPTRGNINRDLWNLENPEDWHIITFEHFDTYMRVLVDEIERWKRTKAQVNDAIRAHWDTPRAKHITLQVRKWNGTPILSEYMDESDPVEMLTEYFEHEERGTLIPVVEQPEHNDQDEDDEQEDHVLEDTPTQPTETDMDIELVDTIPAMRPGKNPEWKLEWKLIGLNPTKDIKLILDGPFLGTDSYVTTGLAHVYVDRDWKHFSYWLEEDGQRLNLKRIHTFGVAPDPVEPDTDAVKDVIALIAYNNALANQMEEQALNLRLKIGILEGIKDKLAQ